MKAIHNHYLNVKDFYQVANNHKDKKFESNSQLSANNPFILPVANNHKDKKFESNSQLADGNADAFCVANNHKDKKFESNSQQKMKLNKEINSCE